MIRSWRTAAAVFSVAALAACRVGPNYHAPALPSGAASPLISLDASVETPQPPPDRWWWLYNDSRLDALVEEALKANRTLAAADAHFAAARAVLTAVHANRYPSTEASAGGIYGRDAVTDEILELGGHPPQTFWLFDDIIQSAYEIDLFGRVHREIEAANASADAVAAARDGVKVVVAAETARAYAAICALGEELDVARHSLDVVAREADITVKRQEAGGDSIFNVARAQALVAEVRSSIPGLEGERRAALFDLTALLGRTPAEAPDDLQACTAPPRPDRAHPGGRRRSAHQASPGCARGRASTGGGDRRYRGGDGGSVSTIRLVGIYGGAAATVATQHEYRSDLGDRPIDQLVISQYGRTARSRPQRQG